MNGQASQRVSPMHRDENGPGNQARGGRRSVVLALAFLLLPASAWAGHPQPILRDALQILLTVNGDFDTAGLADETLRQRLLQSC